MPTGQALTRPPILCVSRSPAWIRVIRARQLSKFFSMKVRMVLPNPCRPPSFASATSATKPSLATSGNRDGSVPSGGYTPYALREGLYQRGWNDYFKLLQKFWQPYLDGTASFDDAIARMVSSL